MDKLSRRKDVSDCILKIASDLFSAEGLYQVGINRIIAEAGVAKATFYKHFPTHGMTWSLPMSMSWASAGQRT